MPALHQCVTSFISWFKASSWRHSQRFTQGCLPLMFNFTGWIHNALKPSLNIINPWPMHHYNNAAYCGVTCWQKGNAHNGNFPCLTRTCCCNLSPLPCPACGYSRCTQHGWITVKLPRLWWRQSWWRLCFWEAISQLVINQTVAELTFCIRRVTNLSLYTYTLKHTICYTCSQVTWDPLLKSSRGLFNQHQETNQSDQCVCVCTTLLHSLWLQLQLV